MKVKAIRVIRSATLNGHIHMPGEEAVVIVSRADTLGRELLTVRWLKDDDVCVVLNTDVRAVESPTGSVVESGVCATIATPPRADQPKSDGVASSLPDTKLRPVTQMADRVERQGNLHPVLSPAWNGVIVL